MTLQKYLIPTVIMSSYIGNALGCPQRNTSCVDIKTGVGFRFPYDCPEGREISMFDSNETLLAHATPGAPPRLYEREVVSMDNSSVVMRRCQDLQMKCLIPNGKYVKETCVDYKITEKMENHDLRDLASQDRLIIGVSCGMVALFAIIGIIFWICLRYICWKNELRKQQRAATLSQFPFLSYLTCRKGIFQAASTETRHDQNQDQESDAADLGTAHNNNVIWLSETAPVTDPHEGGENEPHNTLESVCVHSIDPEADGKTPQSFSLDHNFNEGVQPSKNGYVSGLHVNRASNHRAMHRNMRDDPGGVNDDREKCTVRIRELTNGQAHHVDRGCEDHEDEPLLVNQRAAIQPFGMTGEATVLVNEQGFNLDQVSMCSTAPDTDVESTPNDHEELKYT